MGDRLAPVATSCRSLRRAGARSDTPSGCSGMGNFTPELESFPRNGRQAVGTSRRDVATGVSRSERPKGVGIVGTAPAGRSSQPTLLYSPQSTKTMSPMDELRITRPDDWHLHLRDGPALPLTVGHSARYFGRAIIMPNLVPPVTTARDARQYHERIMDNLPEGSPFDALMTLYLTDRSTPEIIREAAEGGLVVAAKLYPAGATTNSAHGVTDIRNIDAALETMSVCGMPLLIHGEETAPDIDIFDREKRFIDDVLMPLLERFPGLKVVLEHITTREAVDFVHSTGGNVAATITAHHLLYNRNHMLVGGIRPHLYCLPILKRNTHQQALLDAVASGSPQFFLGTDSAPHARDKKETDCGCAGCYTAHAALELYATAFEEIGALDRLEGFASLHGPDFYGLPRNSDSIVLRRENWRVPDHYAFADTQVVPIMASRELNWKVYLD